MTELGVQADRARRGGWGRERSIIDRPGPALPDFDRPGSVWGVGEGEVCYRQTRPDIPGFRPTGLGVGGGGGRGLLQTDPAWHSRISTDRARPIYKFPTSVCDGAQRNSCMLCNFCSREHPLREVIRSHFSESFSGPLPMTPWSQDETTLRRVTSSSCTWACGLRGTSGHCLPSLHDLCKLWDEQSMDLLTRSLKYKQLITDSNLLSHCLPSLHDLCKLWDE